MLCVYCDVELPESDATLEHIWPKALGGHLLPPSIFQTKSVCKQCNSNSGLYVDGAFIRSALSKIDEGTTAEQYLVPSRPVAAPLIYRGFLDDFPCGEDDVCERWQGLSGEHIYHVHAKDEAVFQTFAGGDPIKRKRARSRDRAYLALTTESEYWSMIALLSFYSQFRRARRIVVNSDFLGSDVIRKKFWPQPNMTDQVEAREVAFVRSSKGSQRLRLPINLAFDVRFIAKIGLGIGYNLLGPMFLESTYAKELRRAMWSRSVSEREGLSLRGTRFIDLDLQHNFGDFLGRNLAWPGAWQITIKAVENLLCVLVFTPAGRMHNICITDVLTSFPSRGLERDGLAFVVQNLRSFAVGPIDLNSYIAHRLGEIEIADLRELESLRVSAEMLPPKHI